MCAPIVPVAVALLLSSQLALAEEALRNWFNDPFVQLVAQDPECPTPAGPFVTEKERLAQSHRRAEKGTTAWLAGEAERPGAFAYDADIAAALQDAFRAETRFRGGSLWATVQGRVVYVEGCLSSDAEVAQLEATVRALPYVQQSIALVRTDKKAKVPYRRMPQASARRRHLGRTDRGCGSLRCPQWFKAKPASSDWPTRPWAVRSDG